MICARSIPGATAKRAIRMLYSGSTDDTRTARALSQMRESRGKHVIRMLYTGRDGRACYAHTLCRERRQSQKYACSMLVERQSQLYACSMPAATAGQTLRALIYIGRDGRVRYPHTLYQARRQSQSDACSMPGERRSQ
ncbi:hypothetical protein chiPu_0018578 [Chiloscyllium punctatum]|uniref:Uncharacterized protein n=1 Tax=Chiloscyllium punctatum TaxID=137246 RepID=A0A401RNV7_CHIPU|nr:hypothetical protein [Chiloscyllium punctatum]